MVEVLGKRFLGVNELAEVLGYHIQSVYRLIKQRKIKAKKIFGRYYIELEYIKRIVGEK